MPLVNTFARTPPVVWAMGWMPSPSGHLRTHLPPLPTDFLQEKNVLREFVFRCNVIGSFERYFKPLRCSRVVLVSCRSRLQAGPVDSSSRRRG